MTRISASDERIAANPRNPWSRVLAALDESGARDLNERARMLDTLRYSDAIDDELFRHFRNLMHRSPAAVGIGKVNIPTDYYRPAGLALHRPFRTVSATAKFPKPYPHGLALPEIIGNANDYGFIEDFANTSNRAEPRLAVDVIASSETEASIAVLLAGLESQDYAGRIRLHLFGAQQPTDALSATVEIHHHPVPVMSSEAGPLLSRIAAETDLLLFVSGFVVLDATVLKRIAHIAEVSDRVVHALVPETFGETITPFTNASKRHFARNYPFRDVCGLNFAVSAKLYRDCGGLDARFAGAYEAGRELCFRFYNSGCYFRPVPTDEVRDYDRSTESGDSDKRLFTHLCPNHWDRKRDGSFQVPKISIYIPAYNAGRYLARAVESVLSQDVQDLEVCIADDGSSDDTLKVLEARYGGNPRVRWETASNGGIGFASNRAIAMSRGLYVGQLDSDDCLKPGAIRTLAAYLDDNPDASCCYGSAERVDAAGNYLQNEYSWSVFSREKMMVTSIAHHFRMFRRQSWERTERFREDIMNAVDYDMFLKLSEVGRFHHIEEFLYQRRWHGQNTSSVNEQHQSTNTHRVQREALSRLGLSDFWDIHVADPAEPRRVGYRRRAGKKLVLFWPYYRANPYQRLLYAPHSQEMEICAGTIDAALREIRDSAHPEDHIFHLHWLNFLFDKAEAGQAREAADDFLAKIELFKALGGTVVWTIHNVVSHDAVDRDVELQLSARLAELADVLHFHSARSVAEVAAEFPVPEGKVRIARHGNYIGAYPNLVSQAAARQYLGLAATDDVILFNGQVRKYKGVEQLVSAFRNILSSRPTATLVIAGAAREDPLSGLSRPLSQFERSRIRMIDSYIDDNDLQVYLNAADFAVYPYKNILTSGSLMLALSFGVPAIVPDVGMVREVLENSDAGIMYDGSASALEAAMRQMLEAKDRGELNAMADDARRVAEEQKWERLF